VRSRLILGSISSLSQASGGALIASHGAATGR
jgi:hypothetical protein